tara:strand:- start:489 stop:1064 length:576 start_codon:yes stop_codon:yes gene_type:complete
MKKIIQLILVLFLIFIAAIFYMVYFSNSEKTKTSILKDESQSNLDNKNNLIRNLKYDVKFDGKNQYTITADLSEISYQNDIEIVNMKQVIAIIVDKTNEPLTITSNEAVYNNSNYNTNFIDNVKVNYKNNTILAEKMDLNFSENLITIYEKVNYEGLQGIITADYVKIDLITKKIQIYMSSKDEKVKVITK